MNQQTVPLENNLTEQDRCERQEKQGTQRETSEEKETEETAYPLLSRLEFPLELVPLQCFGWRALQGDRLMAESGLISQGGEGSAVQAREATLHQRRLSDPGRLTRRSCAPTAAQTSC